MNVWIRIALHCSFGSVQCEVGSRFCLLQTFLLNSKLAGPFQPDSIGGRMFFVRYTTLSFCWVSYFDKQSNRGLSNVLSFLVVGMQLAKVVVFVKLQDKENESEWKFTHQLIVVGSDLISFIQLPLQKQQVCALMC